MAIETADKSKHDTVLDVTEERIALTYAEALLGAATGVEQEAVTDLEAIVDEVLDPHPQFTEVIRSAFLSHEERVGLLDRVLGGKVTPVVLDFLKVVSDHNRLGILRTIARQTKALHEERNNNIRVQVRSAHELPPELVAEIESKAREYTGKEPIVSLSVDPELIAGILIRIGDTVLDGSLKTTVAKARQAIVDSTIAKIERDPDTFYSEK